MIYKSIKYLITGLVLFTLGINFVNAEELNFDKQGSITIELIESTTSTKVEGAEISLYKIADAYEINNNLNYKYVENLLSCTANLLDENIKLRDEALYNCVKNSEITPFIKTTDVNGIAKFNDLTLGLYLAVGTNNIEGISSVEAFAINIPQELGDEWIYDIKAYPKTDITRLIDLSVNKVWNNNSSSKTPTSVTIELLKGKEVIDTVILNKDNEWNYIWYDLKQRDDYSVREINIPKGYTATIKNVEYDFTVTNTNKLPQTGFITYKVFVTSLLGLFFIVIGVFITKGNKYE